MSTYVLVHGAWHGGWCFDKLVPLLEERGHTVLAPDLAGLGADTTPLETVSLAMWRDAIVKLVEAQIEPVVLVGHSRGGVVISEVAEAVPDKIRTLVYLTAFLLRDGESLFAVAQTDTEALIGPYFAPMDDGVAMGIREDGVVPVFYGDCAEADIARAKSLWRLEPMAALATPIHVTERNFGRVPRTYIFCSEDRAIGPATQRRMVDASPVSAERTLATSHSPFLSAPEKTAEAILELSAAT